MGSSGLASVLETHTRQEDQQRDTAKSSQERLPDPLPLHGFYSTTMKSAFCLTLVRKTTPSRGCGTGRGALWSSRKGFPSGSPPMVSKGGSERAACPMGRAAAPWHLPSPCLGPPLESALPPRNGNSCLLWAAGQAGGWKFHTLFPPSVSSPSL